MSQRLASAVHLTDTEGVVHSFLPGDDVPRWARKRITNPKAWAESEEDSPADSGGEETRRNGIPPKAGRGSSVEAWRAYAEANDFDVDADVGRDEIIAALAANDIPTE